ncbi:hypothetical protein [Allorhizobium borbori]|uniref:Uncharacterized protein n=1 Tax=Allorhizobium borbori TaxID=485907 RepID=A0A7W6K0R9_9HYPH|nr:hypothetical protein [Allorhizobium borbori]MBB4103079.1 hypothetical protein [Allorhizobium borbori]
MSEHRMLRRIVFGTVMLLVALSVVFGMIGAISILNMPAKPAVEGVG